MTALGGGPPAGREGATQRMNESMRAIIDALTAERYGDLGQLEAERYAR